MSLFKGDKLSNFFSKHFSFESNIDLSDEVEVLYRRNVVIKNIMLVSNIVYSILLFVVTFGDDSTANWLFTVIPFPTTFLINKTIKKIYSDKTNKTAQQVAMYMSAFYMFLTAIIIYIKLETMTNNYLAPTGYMLLYYSLIVVSLYQSRAMLKKVFVYMLCIVTVLHVFITHKLHLNSYSQSVLSFIRKFPGTPECSDIVFRTIIMCCFMLVVYSICAIGEKMSQARTVELSKREDIQEDFTGIVANLFDVLINSNVTNTPDEETTKMLFQMTEKLASIYGYAPNECLQLAEYSQFLTQHKEDFQLRTTFANNDEEFEYLRNQTNLGTQLVRRTELAQKTETIIRSHIEDSISPVFVTKMNQIQKNPESEIILLADMYITLRSFKSYKRPYIHKKAIEQIVDTFSIYFDDKLIDRFVKFEKEFERIFNGE